MISKFNFYAVCAGLLFLIVVGKSEAASFSYANTCYGDTNSALAAFSAQFPKVSNDGYIYSLASVPTINSSGLLSFQVNYRYITKSTDSVGALQTLQLPGCTSGLVANGRVEYMLTIFATLACFLFGFSVGKGQFENRFYGERA